MALFELSVIFLLVILNGLFAMAELAIVSCKRGQIELLAHRGDQRAVRVLAVINDPTWFLSTVQVGITLIGILAGVYGGATFADKLANLIAHVVDLGTYNRGVSMTIVVLLITYLSLVIGELLPKRIALANAEKIALVAIGPLLWIAKCLRPLVAVLQISTEGVVRLLPLELQHKDEVTEEEIRSLIKLGIRSGAIEEGESQIVQKAMRLGDRSVGSIMTARNSLIWLDVNQSIEENWNRACKSPHLYFPVGQGHIDSFIGIVSFKDLAAARMDGNTADVTELVSEPVKVPVTSTVLQLIARLRESGTHFAVVVDEYGGVDGVATVHDLLECLVGEFNDAELENHSATERQDGSWLLDASMDVLDALDKLAIPHPEVEDQAGYHSLGGFILSKLGHIPREGEWIEHEGVRLEVVDMDRNRIDKVLAVRATSPLTAQD